MKFAIIENEFGEVGVDDAIILQHGEEEVVEMMNGCICCTVRGDLVSPRSGVVSRDGPVVKSDPPDGSLCAKMEICAHRRETLTQACVGGRRSKSSKSF